MSGGGGMEVGSSGMGMMTSSSMGMSSGGSMSGERSMMSSSSMGMGMGSSSSMNMGSSSGLMSSGGMGHSMDSVGRDSFQHSPVSSGRGFRDSFERGHDSFSSSSMSDTVVLGNLPSSFTWQMLKDRFRDIGEVRYAEMKGQGTAMLRFASVQDAQRATDLMNNIRFDGRTIQARLY